MVHILVISQSMAACLEPDDPGGGGSDSQASHVSVHPKAPWGPARPRGGPGGPTYSSIASIHLSEIKRIFWK